MTTDGPTPIEVRLTTLQGDRLCIHCGFNLHGQIVVREPAYGMVLVRCPECSTPASLQEYPLLGKWPGRIAAALAAAWLLVLIGGLFASAGITLAITDAAVETGSAKLATGISKKFVSWYEAADEPAKAKLTGKFGTGGVQLSTGPYSYIDSVWWNAQDKRTILSELGGLGNLRAKELAAPLIGAIFAGMVMGFVWSVFLLGLARPRLLVVGVIIIGMAFAFELMWGTLGQDRFNQWTGGVVWANGIASQILAPYLVALALSTSLLSLFIGLWTGRPLVRWLVRLLLPPRSAAALSILWIAEGKSLPKPRPRPRTKAVPKPN